MTMTHRLILNYWSTAEGRRSRPDQPDATSVHELSAGLFERGLGVLERTQGLWVEVKLEKIEEQLNPRNSAAYQVELLAFTDPVKVRTVRIPEAELAKLANETNHALMLEAIYRWGQNDFQAQELPSVSAGDVIRYGGRCWLVADVGFLCLSQAELKQLRETPQRERLPVRWEIQAAHRALQEQED